MTSKPAAEDVSADPAAPRQTKPPGAPPMLDRYSGLIVLGS